LELLERQFPAGPARQVVLFKNANQFASQLAVHPDHLNRAVKNITGKTTTETIMERTIREAKSLLVETSEDITGIAYLLGFQHASHFITFFKKQTGQTPNHFRKNRIAIS
jgi:AraC family transcriptional activator of pobA